jgi:hypothetical protein
MRRIAAISAVFGGANSGMLSVDYAFHALIRRLGIDAELSYFILNHPDDLTPGHDPALASLPFRYTRLLESAEAIRTADLVVFLGDFFQARHYHVEDVVPRLLQFSVAPTPDDALRVCRELFLLSNAPNDVLARTVLLGGNLLANRQSDYLDTAYRDALVRLLRGAQRIWMRDVHSALKVAHLTGDYGRSYLGADAALLLRPDEVALLATTELSRSFEPGPDPRAGFFFARTRTSPQELAAIAFELCTALQVAPQFFPWNRFSGAHAYRDMHARLLPQSAVAEPFWERRWPLGDLFHLLRHYRFVVTDTYHLCVNAWREGVPAVCITQPDDVPGLMLSPGTLAVAQQSISEGKKSAFYSMYDAQDFLVNITNWRVPAQRRLILARLSALLRDRDCVQGIVDRVRRHGEAFARDLGTVLAPGVSALRSAGS